jgi:transposase
MSKQESSTSDRGFKSEPGKKKVGSGALKVVNVNAAGIDVGSRRHYVAVPSDRSEEEVRSFGCLTPDLHDMARWLKSCGIETVALESTGVYWVPVMGVLESYGIEAYLVDARQAKHVPGRKSDVQDCQWLRDLHTFGLLRAAFRPDREMGRLRTYWRHRADLVESCAQQIHRMQKSLEQMNIQLHKVLSDISGQTGFKIIRAIVAGERRPGVLAGMRNNQVKSSAEEIVKALTGEYREEHLFTLKQAIELYDVYQEKIRECDGEVEKYMSTFGSKGDPNELDRKPSKKGGGKRRKNQPHFDIGKSLYQMTGVDLTQIDGISDLTAQTIISECGFDMSRFPSEKHFASWLSLCPQNQITGGRVIKRRTRKGGNRLSNALRMAAQSLHHAKSAMGAFYRRMRSRLGGAKAITATAHKLACQVYRMLKYGQNYVDQGQQAYEKQYQNHLIQSAKRQARKLGLQLVRADTGEVVS